MPLKSKQLFPLFIHFQFKIILLQKKKKNTLKVSSFVRFYNIVVHFNKRHF